MENNDKIQTHSGLRDETKEKNFTPEYIKELKEIVNSLNKNLSKLPSDLSKALEKINSGHGNKKDFEKIIDSIDGLDDSLKKGLDKNNTLLAKWKIKNFESAKKIQDLVNISLNFKGDAKATKFLGILSEIEKRAANSEYNFEKLAKKINDIDFSNAKTGTDLLEKLSKGAYDCGVSISTLGVNFDSSGKRLNIFNKAAEDSFDRVKKLREDFDKCSAETFAFGLAIYSTSKKLIDIQKNYDDVITKTIEYRRSLQMLSGASPDLLPGGSKQLDSIRKNMNLTREETVKFAQIVQELRGTTYTIDDLTNAMQGMKDTIGEVDVSQLEKLAGIMKSIPKEQIDAFANGSMGTNANAAVLNMVKSGKTRDVDSLITSGALGKTAAKAAGVSISEGDKGYLNSKRSVKNITETAQNEITDLTSGILKYLPYLAAIGGVVGIGAKIYGQIGALNGGIKALSKIINNDVKTIKSDTSSINKNTRISGPTKNKKVFNKIEDFDENSNRPTSFGKNKRTGRSASINGSVKNAVITNFKITNSKLTTLITLSEKILSAIPSGSGSENFSNLFDDNKTLRKSGKKRINGKVLNRQERIERIAEYRKNKLSGNINIGRNSTGGVLGKFGSNINKMTGKFNSGIGKVIETTSSKFGLITSSAGILAKAFGALTVSSIGVIGAYKEWEKTFQQFDQDKNFWGNGVETKGGGISSLYNGFTESISDSITFGLNKKIPAFFKNNKGLEKDKKKESVNRMLGRSDESPLDSMVGLTTLFATIGSIVPGIGTAVGAAVGMSVSGIIEVIRNFETKDEKKLRLIYEEIYDVRKNIQDVKQFEAFQLQNFKRQAVDLDGILSQIREGVFSAVENLTTTVSLNKMNNSFLLGLSKGEYETESNLAQDNSFSSLKKNMDILDKKRNDLNNNFTISYDQKVLLLGKIMQEEIELRKKFKEEFLESLSLNNIPTVIEGELKKQINQSTVTMNSGNNTFFGSTTAINDKLGKNLEISLSNFDDQVSKFTINIGKISDRDKKDRKMRMERSDSIGSTFINGPKLSDTFKSMNESFIDSYENLTPMIRTDLFNLIKSIKNGNSVSPTHSSGWTMNRTIRSELKETFSELNNIFNDKNSSYTEFASAADKWEKIAAATLLTNGNGEENNSKEQYELIKHELETAKEIKKLFVKYSGDFKYFSKDASKMTADDFEKALKDEGIKKEFKKAGILEDNGKLKSNKLEQARDIYSNMRSKNVENAAFKELSNDKFFQKIQKNYGVTDITKTDEKTRSQIFNEYQKGRLSENSKSISEKIFKDDKEKQLNFNDLFSKTNEDSNFLQNYNLEDNSKQNNEKFNGEISNTVKDISLLNKDLQKVDINSGNVNKAYLQKILKDADDASKQLSSIESAKEVARSSGKESFKFGGKEFKLGSKEAKTLEIQLVKSFNDASNKIGSSISGQSAGSQVSAQTIEAIRASGKTMANSVFENVQQLSQLSDSQKKLMDSILDLTKILEYDSNVRLKQIDVETRKAKFVTTAWNGGNVGEAKTGIFGSEIELNKAKQDALEGAKSVLIEKSKGMSSSGFGAGFSGELDKLIDKEFGGNQNGLINKDLKEISKVVANNNGKTDEDTIKKATTSIDDFAKNAKNKLKEKYSGNTKEDKDAIEKGSQAIDSMKEAAKAVVSAGGNIQMGIKMIEMKQAQTTAELITATKELSSSIRSNTDTLKSFSAEAKQYKFDNLANLFKVSFAATKDIKDIMVNGIKADKDYYNDQLGVNKQYIESVSKQISVAKENVKNAKTPEEKQKAENNLVGLNAALDTAQGKNAELESQKMAAIAKRLNESLSAITSKFQIATEAVDIAKDSAENVAGTTEEWYRLENERLSLMSQEVDAMKELITQKTLEGVSAEEEAKLRNQLAKKQLDFEKEKIGAQRNVFEKQLGAIVGNLQQSGAFRGVHQAAVFGAGYGINEAGMANKKGRERRVGYTNRLALKNAENGIVPTGRLGAPGDIEGAATDHLKMNGKSKTALESAFYAKKEIETLNDKFSKGEISKEERDKKESEINNKREKEISSMKSEDILKNMLDCLINIAETLNSQEFSFNENGNIFSQKIIGNKNESFLSSNGIELSENKFPILNSEKQTASNILNLDNFGINKSITDLFTAPDLSKIPQIVKNNESTPILNPLANNPVVNGTSLIDSPLKQIESFFSPLTDLFDGLKNKVENVFSTGDNNIQKENNLQIVLKLDNTVLAREVVKVIAGNDNMRIMHSTGSQISNKPTNG